MSTSTVRVELYDLPQPSKDLYEKLHEKMEANKFKRKIKVGNDWYQLPDAEYSFDGGTSLAVLELAKRCATSIWPKARILVTQTTEQRMFWDLIRVKEI